MNKLYTTEQIFASEKSFFNKGHPQLELMLNAAHASADWLLNNFPKKKFLFLIGPGNNGADGLYTANILQNNGLEALVLDVFPRKLKSDLNSEAWKKLTLKKIKSMDKISKNTVIIDSIFGIGGKARANKKLQRIIEAANTFNHRVAIDSPTGIDLTHGRQALTVNFEAQITLTFLGLKQGFYLCSHNILNTGKIILLDLNKTVLKTTKSNSTLFGFDDIGKILPERKQDTHKGNHGKLAILAGDEGMGGAGILTAMSALMSGAGVIKLLTRKAHIAPALAQIPEVMVIGGDNAQDLELKFGWEDVLVAGPGFFKNYWSEQNLYKVLAYSQKSKSRLVIDAGALSMLSEKPFSKFKLNPSTVLTPHPGEAASLLKTSSENIQKNRVAAAKKLHKKFGCIIVLKGMHTVIAFKEKIFICENGSPSLATPGSGDVLTGIIGSFMAQGLTSVSAAKAGVAVHGLAGEILANEVGSIGITAQDIISTIRSLMN